MLPFLASEGQAVLVVLQEDQVEVEDLYQVEEGPYQAVLELLRA